jgi:hypothetical protein
MIVAEALGRPPLPEEARARFWAKLGARPSEVEELCSFTSSRFDFDHLPPRFPLPDEPYVAVWQSYAYLALQIGAVACLRERLVQLRFPIRAGMSGTEDYRAATRAGRWPETSEDLPFEAPEAVRIFVHATPAGRIPVVVAGARADFVALVQALTCRNEPVPVPPSMGACIVSGFNNWDRIARLKVDWESGSSSKVDPEDWPIRFSEIARSPELYQDRFIILSAGPYSATPASALGLSDEDWQRRSLIVRLEHECTHHFTRQVLGSMRNSLPEELVADYMGIIAAEGHFRADWLLRFLGLEGTTYRPGGRLENYRGTRPLSQAGFAHLQVAVRRAIDNLASFRPPGDKARTIIALSRLGLEGLAAGPIVV